jgi:hypothetical protein
VENIIIHRYVAKGWINTIKKEIFNFLHNFESEEDILSKILKKIKKKFVMLSTIASNSWINSLLYYFSCFYLGAWFLEDNR